MKIFLNFFLVLVSACCMACAHSSFTPIDANQTVKAIHAGAPALPYLVYSQIPLPAVNQGFKDAQSTVTLEDTYRSVYNYSFDDLPKDGNTGMIFETTEVAGQFLRKILQSRGVDNFDKYYVTRIRTADENGCTLISAIYRPTENISVFNKFNFLARETLTPADPAFFRPYRTDTDRNPLDTVYEWAALPLNCISNQASQAILLTLLANKIMNHKADESYWREERQWIAGNFFAVLVKQDISVCGKLGIDQGFTQMIRIKNN